MAKTTNILNKALKHLKKNWIKYGFETLVVIIGILLALALNNWNDNRLQNIKESQYLERLLKDLIADTTYYNVRITSSETLVAYHREFIRKMYQKQQSFQEVQVLFSQLTWQSEQLTTQNATYIEMTGSGNLNILRNQELKDAIVHYYRKNEEAIKHIAEFDEFSGRKLTDLTQIIRNVGKFYSHSSDIYEGLDFFDDEDWAFMNEPHSEKFQALEHTLMMYRFKHKTFLNQYFKPLKDKASQLIQDIEKELENRN